MVGFFYARMLYSVDGGGHMSVFTSILFIDKIRYLFPLYPLFHRADQNKWMLGTYLALCAVYWIQARDAQVAIMLSITSSILYLIGLLIMMRARQQLNQIKETYTISGKRIVQTGLYRRIRHPQYTALLLILASIWCSLQDPYVLVLIVLMGTLILMRIEEEEKELIDLCNEEYKQYKKHTYQLIPFIY
jgi:protein-S-isoprenylcysteine O-methyltransferase Ste14